VSDRQAEVKLVFGMTSATERPAVIEQLIDLLDGRTVVLHHDWGKQPGLRLSRPNLHYVEHTHVTGWGTWGLCEAVLSTIQYALDHLEFDYFQLLSPSCMPLRPIDEFEAKLASDPSDGHVDLVDIRTDPDFLVNYGWRMFAPRGSLRQRALNRLRALYFGPDAPRVQRFGLSVLSDNRVSPSLRSRLARRSAIGLVHLLSTPTISGHPFSPAFRAYVGSLWFGASRELCEEIVKAAREPRIVDYFSKLVIPDEMVFPTLIGNAGRRIGPANHVINTFNDRGNPRTFKSGDLDGLLASKAFFARKFPGNPTAPLRTALIERAALPNVRAAQVGTAGVLLRRPLKVVFGTMTTEPGAAGAEAVGALATALQGRLLVVHDAAGIARDELAEVANIDWASAPLTGGFRPSRLNAGLLQLLRYCVECVDFDYLQLVPPGYVPTGSIDAFEHFVEHSEFDAHADLLRLKSKRDFAVHAARVCCAPRSSFAPILRWIGAHHPADASVRSLPPLERASSWAAAVARMVLPMRHKPLRGFTPSVGSAWFGAGRDVCQHVVRYAADSHWVE
jgi:hypothetical protein